MGIKVFVLREMNGNKRIVDTFVAYDNMQLSQSTVDIVNRLGYQVFEVPSAYVQSNLGLYHALRDSIDNHECVDIPIDVELSEKG